MTIPEIMNIKGLKCDAPACTYADADIPFEDYEAHIDAPCPSCGAPLLTQANYNTVCELIRIAKLVQNVPGLAADPDAPVGQLSIDLNGTGVIEQMTLTTLDEVTP